jgi:hypothetical protein
MAASHEFRIALMNPAEVFSGGRKQTRSQDFEYIVLANAERVTLRHFRITGNRRAASASMTNKVGSDH